MSARGDRQTGVQGWFDGRLDVQPPLSDEQTAQIPSGRGVVALLGPGGQPILLTTAASIRSRLRRRLEEREDPSAPRKKTADLREVTRQILWKLATGHFETDLHFLELAERMFPRRFASMLAWGQPWFVHVDADEAFPHFTRTRKVLEAPGTYVGPFAAARQADAFIDTIQDAFGLCRLVRCLRQAPHGQPCAYAQMGLCPSPCDGRIPMAEYREMVARAAEFAVGCRQGFRQELSERMQAAAKRLAFEQAAVLKKRLDRLADLDSPAWVHVAAIQAFRFVLVQPGAGSRQAKVFLADRGRVAAAKPLDYPLKDSQLRGVLARMRRHVSGEENGGCPHFSQAERWRLALVAHYLLAGENRRGLILRWREDLTAHELAEAIESARKALGLRMPAPRRSKKDPGQDTSPEDSSR